LPLLSIVIPRRDRARYVGAYIGTALQSGDVPVEIFVLSNASTDKTRDVVSAIGDLRLFGSTLDAMFPHADIVRAMTAERLARKRRGLSVAGLDQAERAACMTPGGTMGKSGRLDRLSRLAGALGAAMPIHAQARSVRDVLGAAKLLQELLVRSRSRNLQTPLAKLGTTRRIGRG